MQTFKRNSYFVMEKPFRIISGFVIAKSVLDDGSYQATGIFQQGDLIIPCEHLNNFEFKSLAQTKIEHPLIDSSDYFNLQQKNVEIFIMFNKLARLKRISYRLDALLKYLQDNFAENNFLKFKITHEDIAELLSCTRCTATRELRKLENDGYISSEETNLEFKKEFGTQTIF